MKGGFIMSKVEQDDGRVLLLPTRSMPRCQPYPKVLPYLILSANQSNLALHAQFFHEYSHRLSLIPELFLLRGVGAGADILRWSKRLLSLK